MMETQLMVSGQPQDTSECDDRFETTIRETVEAVGGVLLFQMKLEEAERSHWPAAVAIEGDDSVEVMIIEVPCDTDGGDVDVRPAAQSDLPIAGIATAYAGLAECWKRAA